MKIKNTLKHLVERVTFLLSNKKISIRAKIFIGVSLFVILNIIINLLIVRISINDIYLGLEKSELKKEYDLVINNIDDEETLGDIIYDANNNGIKIKLLDNNLNIIYTIFNEGMNNKFENLNKMLLNSLGSNESKIIILKNYEKSGYDLHLVGKTKIGYAIISTSIESLRKGAKTTTIVIIITSLLSFVILLIVSYFISKIFSKKINEIKEVTDDITNLKFNKKINISSNDELGNLFNNINIMSDKLENNIKELESANKRLKQDLIDKEKQEIARKKLIANISHEFKTPLTIISGYSQLIKEEIKNKEAKKNLGIIISESERLSDLVHEFLELSKLESGNVELKKEIINFESIIKKELDKLNVEINNKKIKVITKFNGDQSIAADKKQITKVIENILTNAIKFCKNDMLIEIKTYTKDDYFYYEVFNTGDIIKDSDIENIFNSYYKDKSTRNKEGTGLGLTIVKAIVDLHNGNCKVKNAKDGVKFVISIKNKNSY